MKAMTSMILILIALVLLVGCAGVDPLTKNGPITYTCYSGGEVVRRGEGVAYNVHPADMWAIHEVVDGVDTVVYLPRVSCILEGVIDNE